MKEACRKAYCVIVVQVGDLCLSSQSLKCPPSSLHVMASICPLFCLSSYLPEDRSQPFLFLSFLPVSYKASLSDPAQQGQEPFIALFTFADQKILIRRMGIIVGRR